MCIFLSRGIPSWHCAMGKVGGKTKNPKREEILMYYYKWEGWEERVGGNERREGGGERKRGGKRVAPVMYR